MASTSGGSASYWSRTAIRPLLRRRALALLGATTAVALAACGRRTPAAHPAQAGADQSKPVAGGRLAIAAGSDYFDFDPSGKPSGGNQNVISWNYDALLATKSGTGVDFWDHVLEPGLAERWEMPDPLTYTFHLRRGATFFNLPPMNGREVTAEDVKWSMEYLSRAPRFAADAKLAPSIIDYTYEGLESIQTPDKYTAIARFSNPFAPFLNYSAWDWNAILAHEVYDRDGNFSSNVAGSGPFQLDLTGSQRGERWIFKKNPNYFLSGRPYLDQINVLVLPDDPTQLAAFKARQIDVLGAVNATSIGIDAVKNAVPDATPNQYLNAAKNLSMGSDKPPFADARVRKALSLCVDRDEFLKVFSGGNGQWALGASMPGIFTETETKQILSYDPEQAKQLLAEAGYPNGIDAELLYPGVFYGQQHVNEIQLLQSQARRGNIRISLKAVDKATESIRQKQGAYQLNLVPKIIVGGDLDGLLYAGFYSSSGANYGHVRDAKLDQMLIAQRRELDQTKRRELVRAAVRYINETPWSVGLYHGTAAEFLSPSLKNYGANFSRPGLHLTESWLER
jgi:peptide/nickel transport system substrate-binding protein